MFIATRSDDTTFGFDAQNSVDILFSMMSDAFAAWVLTISVLSKRGWSFALGCLAVSLLASSSHTFADEVFPLTQVKSFTWVVDYEGSWSPDGKQIVLVSSRHGGMKLHVLNTDSPNHGSDMRQLTTGPDEDDSPAWSPDGTRIAFVSVRSGVSQIMVVNPDGSGQQQLTEGNAENIHPTWSPDSQRILFNTTKFSGATAADGVNIPSGNKIIGEQIDKKMDLATIRADGTDLRRITTGGGYTYAMFSPDGKAILHRRIDGPQSRVFVMNADGSDDHGLTGPDTLDGWPTWSNDGQRIVFSRRVGTTFQLFVMKRDGSGVQQLHRFSG